MNGYYLYTHFESGLALTGTFFDRGEDTNANGLFDWLVVEMGVKVPQSDFYSFNARLVDVNGAEIIWASNSQFLTAGTHTVALRFDGRYIYGNGVNGPYHVKDLSIYGSSLVFSLIDVMTTGAYNWLAFERSAVVRGSVMANGQPVANANVFISGFDSDLSDSNGVYRLTVPNSGNYPIQIEADPGLAPWDIWVNSVKVGSGTSAAIHVDVGQETVVDFISGGSHVVPGDLNGDGVIDQKDYLLFRSALGSCVGNPKYRADIDYDHDGCISYADYRVWYSYYKAYNP